MTPTRSSRPLPFREADVIIRGQRLSVGQVMTLRVALGSFLDDLTPEKQQELGPIGLGYYRRAAEVICLLVGDPPPVWPE